MLSLKNTVTLFSLFNLQCYFNIELGGKVHAVRVQRPPPDRAQLLVRGARQRERARAHARRRHSARGALRQVRQHTPPAARHTRFPAQAADATGPTRRRFPRPAHAHAARTRLTTTPRNYASCRLKYNPHDTPHNNTSI